MGSQRVGHDWVTKMNWTELNWSDLAHMHVIIHTIHIFLWRCSNIAPSFKRKFQVFMRKVEKCKVLYCLSFLDNCSHSYPTLTSVIVCITHMISFYIFFLLCFKLNFLFKNFKLHLMVCSVFLNFIVFKKSFDLEIILALQENWKNKPFIASFSVNNLF